MGASVCLMSISAAATPYPPTGEHTNLRPDSARGLCLDFSSSNGAKLKACNGSNAQKIFLTRRGSGEQIMKIGNNCIEGVREGEALFITPCRPVTTQFWTYSNTGQIKNGNGLCVDVWRGEKTANTPVIAYRCTEHVNQRWARFSPQDAHGAADTAVNAMLYPLNAQGKCLDLSPEGRLILWSCHGGTNQKFSFQFERTGQVKVNGRCLTAHPEKDVEQIRGVTCRNDTRQRWSVSANGQFKNGAGNCMDVRGSSALDGTPIITYPCKNQLNQKFKVR